MKTSNGSRHQVHGPLITAIKECAANNAAVFLGKGVPLVNRALRRAAAKRNRHR